MAGEGQGAPQPQQIGFDGKDRKGFLGPGWYAVDQTGKIVAGPYAAEANCAAKIAEIGAKAEGADEPGAPN